MKSNSTGQVDAAGEIGHEHERALEHADEQRRAARVVGGDLLAELGDASPKLGTALTIDRAEIGVGTRDREDR